MKRRWYVVAMIAVVVVAVGAAMHFMHGTPATDADLSRSKATAAGLYVAAIAPEAEPVERGELHSWILTVTDPGGKPVEGATIAVDGGMPDHGHGLPTAPQATDYLGDGRYRIEGVKFSMGGRWELRFDISAPAGNDVAVFNVMM